VARASAGAVEHIPIAVVTNLARYLEEVKGGAFWVYGASGEPAAQSMWETDLTGGVAIVLGAEGKGLRQLTKETCDHVARLDLPGAIQSLNVSNAAAVALYVAASQLKAT
jgi:23S rRNA (guanosine2251-2'-O)-methyltransferase